MLMDVEPIHFMDIDCRSMNNTVSEQHVGAGSTTVTQAIVENTNCNNVVNFKNKINNLNSYEDEDDDDFEFF